MRRVLCWLFGHRWMVDMRRYMFEDMCELLCSRCGKRVDCAPWRWWHH